MHTRVKLDEDLSPAVGHPLTSRGVEVKTVVEQGWSGSSDAEVLERAGAQREMLFTADKGFGDVRAYPPGSHPGIVLLRPDRDSVVELTALVERLALAKPLHELHGCLTVVSPRSIRIRRPKPDA